MRGRAKETQRRWKQIIIWFNLVQGSGDSEVRRIVFCFEIIARFNVNLCTEGQK